MKDFLDYDLKYPNLIIDLIQFFVGNCGNTPKKTIGDFCNSYPSQEGEDKIQPDIIGRICDRLCNMRKMVCLYKGGVMCIKDVYFAISFQPELFEHHRDMLLNLYNSCVYGFDYIYRHYKERTIPIICETKEGQSMGSCFRIYRGLATAKHCLTDGSPVAIRGYDKSQLEQFPIFVSNNPNIDLAFIQTDENYIPNDAEPHVLDNVLVMGYPKVPFFLDFCTGEKANISSMANLRLTPTLGSVAAEGEIYYPRNLPKMLLVTAKICGGNSGGPLINEEGFVVGIATGKPEGEGASDDHVGYGMAYPIQALDDMLQENNTMRVEFMDFPE